MTSFINPNKHPRTAEQIEAAMERFDDEQRDGYNFSQNSFVVLHNGLMYPPKAIIALATGLAVKEFSGGDPSNKYLVALGFKVIDLRQKGYNFVRQASLGAITDAEIAAA